MEKLKSALSKLESNVFSSLSNFDVKMVPQCGEGIWYRVVYLNMSDSSHQCPSAWREFTFDGIRACAKPDSNVESCPGTFYCVGRQYSKVC